MNIHSLTCKLPSRCFACLFSVISHSFWNTQASFIPWVCVYDQKMLWSRVIRINTSKAAFPKMRFQLSILLYFCRPLKWICFIPVDIYSATWNIMGRSCRTKNNSYMSGLLKRMVTEDWQVGTQSGHIVFLLHNWSVDAWWLWGTHSAFDLFCEQRRVALCGHSVYWGPSGHGAALAAEYQETAGLPWRRGRVVQRFWGTACYSKQHKVHHTLM